MSKHEFAPTSKALTPEGEDTKEMEAIVQERIENGIPVSKNRKNSEEKKLEEENALRRMELGVPNEQGGNKEEKETKEKLSLRDKLEEINKILEEQPDLQRANLSPEEKKRRLGREALSKLEKERDAIEETKRRYITLEKRLKEINKILEDQSSFWLTNASAEDKAKRVVTSGLRKLEGERDAVESEISKLKESGADFSSEEAKSEKITESPSPAVESKKEPEKSDKEIQEYNDALKKLEGIYGEGKVSKEEVEKYIKLLKEEKRQEIIAGLKKVLNRETSGVESTTTPESPLALARKRLNEINNELERLDREDGEKHKEWMSLFGTGNPITDAFNRYFGKRGRHAELEAEFVAIDKKIENAKKMKKALELEILNLEKIGGAESVKGIKSKAEEKTITESPEIAVLAKAPEVQPEGKSWAKKVSEAFYGNLERAKDLGKSTWALVKERVVKGIGSGGIWDAWQAGRMREGTNKVVEGIKKEAKGIKQEMAVSVEQAWEEIDRMKKDSGSEDISREDFEFMSKQIDGENAINNERLIEKTVDKAMLEIENSQQLKDYRTTHFGEEILTNENLDAIRAELTVELNKLRDGRIKADLIDYVGLLRKNLDPEWWMRYIYAPANAILLGSGIGLIAARLMAKEDVVIDAGGEKTTDRLTAPETHKTPSSYHPMDSERLSSRPGHAISPESGVISNAPKPDALPPQADVFGKTAVEAVGSATENIGEIKMHDTIWRTSKELLQAGETGIKNPTDGMIQKVSYEIAKVNHVAVPNWKLFGEAGWTDHKLMPGGPGEKFEFLRLSKQVWDIIASVKR